MKGAKLLARARQVHGGSIESFAKDVLGRSRVSVWRWEKKQQPIPETVIARLKAYLTDEGE